MKKRILIVTVFILATYGIFYLISHFLNIVDQQSQITFMLIYQIITIVINNLLCVIGGICLPIFIIRKNREKDLKANKAEHVLLGLYGLYLAIYRVLLYFANPVAVIMYPQWYLYQRTQLSEYFGALLFGIELVLFIQNVINSKKKIYKMDFTYINSDLRSYR